MQVYKSPFDNRKYISKQALYDYMEKEYREELNGLPAAQVYFNWRNRYELNKEFGRCVVSKKPTKFNLTTERYERFAGERERLMYREYFRKNMIKVHGVDTLLNDPEHQKTMLANRSISGVYKWSDKKTETPFTGSYEEDFLRYLDEQLNWGNPEDVMGPAPMTIPYIGSDGNKKFHIPDFYITSLNLIVNIKSADNKHYRLRDLDDEVLQDKEIIKTKFNYIKILDKDYNKFMEILEKIRDNDDNKIFREI